MDVFTPAEIAELAIREKIREMENECYDCNIGWQMMDYRNPGIEAAKMRANKRKSSVSKTIYELEKIIDIIKKRSDVR